MKRRGMIIAVLLAFTLSMSVFALESPSLKDYLNNPDYPQDYWQTASPEEVGLDSSILNQGVQYIDSINAEIHSMLVVKDGKLVFERYGWDRNKDNQHQILPDELHEIHSTTKSITSALVGIAIHEGLIKNVHDPILSYFKDYQPTHLTEEKTRITIDDVLTMRSGLKWIERLDEHHLWEEYDPVQFVLDQPMVAPPGRTWNYSTGGSHILSSILYRVTGKAPALYGKEKLFDPLRISHWRWNSAKNGVNQGGMWLFLTPRDMAKFGYLYLNQGKWEERQLVPQSWVELSVKKHATLFWSKTDHYGYHWWIRGNDCFATSGAFGQDIFVFPKEKTIVVFTANLNLHSASRTLEKIARNYVIGAFQ